MPGVVVAHLRPSVAGGVVTDLGLSSTALPADEPKMRQRVLPHIAATKAHAASALPVACSLPCMCVQVCGRERALYGLMAFCTPTLATGRHPLGGLSKWR